MASLFHYEVNGIHRTVGEFVGEMEVLLSKVSAGKSMIHVFKRRPMDGHL